MPPLHFCVSLGFLVWLRFPTHTSLFHSIIGRRHGRQGQANCPSVSWHLRFAGYDAIPYVITLPYSSTNNFFFFAFLLWVILTHASLMWEIDSHNCTVLKSTGSAFSGFVR